MRLRTIALREVQGTATPAQMGDPKYQAYKDRRLAHVKELAAMQLADTRKAQVKAAGIVWSKLTSEQKALLHLGGELAQAQGPKASKAATPAPVATNVVTAAQAKKLTKAQLVELLTAGE